MESLDRYLALKDICETRKSVRSFSSRPVPKDLIEKIQEIAYTSPYASGKRNWEITAISDKNIIGTMAEAVQVRTQTLSRQIREVFQEDFLAYAANFTAFATAPVVFVPTFRYAPSLSLMLREPAEEIVRLERDTYAKSISCVAMLVLLAAESVGLANCYMTGPLIAEKELGKILKIKRGRSIGALIPVGYT